MSHIDYMCTCHSYSPEKVDAVGPAMRRKLTFSHVIVSYALTPARQLPPQL